MSGDVGRDVRAYLISGDIADGLVADQAAGKRRTIQVDSGFSDKLLELAVEVAVFDENTRSTRRPFGQGAVAGQQQALLALGQTEQGVVFRKRIVGGVVSEDAEPPRQLSKHAVGDEPHIGKR